MKNKIEVGQCYRWDDKVYMVIEKHLDWENFSSWWCVEDTITKSRSVIEEKLLLKQQRPFQNYG